MRAVVLTSFASVFAQFTDQGLQKGLEGPWDNYLSGMTSQYITAEEFSDMGDELDVDVEDSLEL